MNISEAQAVVDVLREAGLLKGEKRGEITAERLAEDVHFLCARAGKALQVSLTPAMDAPPPKSALWRSL